MERKLHEPLTLPKHPELLHEINETSIAIKLWHLSEGSDFIDAYKIGKARASHPEPKWQDMIDLLRKAYNAINEQRENPRRY